MTNFADDMATKRGLFSTTTKKQNADLRPVILFTDVEFFSTLDKEGVPKKEWSLKVWKQVAARYLDGHHRVVICVDDELGKWSKGNFISEHAPADLIVFNIKPGNATENTLRLQITLQELGLQLKSIRNKRTVSFLNIHNYIRGGLTHFNATDYDKAEITMDKELTFADMVKQRSSSAWP